VQDGISGFLVEPNSPDSLADAIMRLASDADLRKRMGQAGREHVSHYFNWPDNLRQMLIIYDKLLQ
jgi:glycosyltransferase involved in cell wall biosynthesis